MNKVLITICARANSKRLPNKALLPFCGMPLIAWTVLQGELSRDQSMDFVLCSDIDKRKLRDYQGPCFLLNRPKELSQDDTPKLDTIRHAVERAEKTYRKRYDIVIDLDVTNPLRLPDDIQKAYKQFLNKKPPTLFSVVQARRKPWFNQVIRFRLAGLDECRNKLPLVSEPDLWDFGLFDLNASIYIYDRNWLDKKENFPIQRDSELYIMQRWQFCDIDYQYEFEIAEMLMKKYVLDRRKND